MSFENFPYSNFHELNLDWILKELKEKYSDENPPDYPVTSVNGQTGNVIIAIPANLVQSVNGETGDVVLYRNPLTQFPATDEVRWNLFRICDGTEKGIEFDADSAKRIAGTRRILIYDEDNPPDYPVTSVNGQTGDVQITAGVQSVNGKTGNVVTPFLNPNTDILTLDSNSPSVLWGISRNVAGGNVALYITTGGTNPQAFIRYTPTDGQAINLPLLTNADIPSSAGVVSVNAKTGAVTLYGTDILLSDTSNDSVTNIINSLTTKLDNLYDSFFETVSGDSLTWQTGYYNASTGAFVSDYNLSIVSQYVDKSIYKIIPTNNVQLVLFAWENDVYKGIYDTVNNTFTSATSAIPYYTTNTIDIYKLYEEYPNYDILIQARFTTTSQILPQDSTNITLIKYINLNNIQTQVNNNTQQISALQTSNTTQNQQISALQSSDTTQNQQISALQTAVDNIQSGAGIKEVKLSEVVTLPARYPATGTDADIKANMACVNAVLSRPGVQRTNFTVEFFDGYLNISGTMQGLTDITLYLTEV